MLTDAERLAVEALRQELANLTRFDKNYVNFTSRGADEKRLVLGLIERLEEEVGRLQQALSISRHVDYVTSDTGEPA
jgi:hypothetical protein